MSTSKDLILYGGLALGAYLIVKNLTEPLKKPIDAASDLATGVIKDSTQVYTTSKEILQRTPSIVYREYSQPTQKILSSAKQISANLSTNSNLATTQSKFLNSGSPLLASIGSSSAKTQAFYNQPAMKIDSSIVRQAGTSNQLKSAVKSASTLYAKTTPVGASYTIGKSVIKSAKNLFSKNKV